MEGLTIEDLFEDSLFDDMTEEALDTEQDIGQEEVIEDMEITEEEYGNFLTEPSVKTEYVRTETKFPAIVLTDVTQVHQLESVKLILPEVDEEDDLATLYVDVDKHLVEVASIQATYETFYKLTQVLQLRAFLLTDRDSEPKEVTLSMLESMLLL